MSKQRTSRTGSLPTMVFVLPLLLAGLIVASALAAGPEMNPPGKPLANADKLAAEKYASGEAVAATGSSAGGRTKVRQLFSFETKEDGSPIEGFEMDGKPVKAWQSAAENMDVVYVQDNGVTDGKWCARMTIPAGKDVGLTELTGDAVKNWADYDYLAIDLFTEETAELNFVVELWDADSKNYATRCTFEEVKTHNGAQTLLYQINRAKRNGKEGRGWEELEDKDKINMNGLKKVKIFTAQAADHPVRLWIDNVRLMQEDAAKPKMQAPLPKNAIAFDFGSAGAVVPGFKAVTAKSKYSDEAGFGFSAGKGLAEGGQGWPDLLTGTFVYAGFKNAEEPLEGGAVMEFKAKVPDGKYMMWLSAGPIMLPAAAGTEYLLSVNDKPLYQDKPDYKTIESEKYLYRFLWTQYSERPNAQWLDYVDKMFPIYQQEVEVTGGAISIKASNFFLSALVLVPVADKADFDRMAAKIQAARIEAFNKATYIPESKKPQPAAGDGAYVLFVPNSWSHYGPSDGPSDQDRKQTSIAQTAAPGQNVFTRVVVTPFKDLGSCTLQLSDLTGPGGAKIPASAIQGLYENWRRSGRYLRENILLPTTTFNGEKGVTQTMWLWLSVPADAKPGKYAGTFNVAAGQGKPTPVPVSIEVLPIKLDTDLPVSYGMYYGGRQGAAMPKAEYNKLIEEQHVWMKKIGFTGSNLMFDGSDDTQAQLLKKLGFGKNPAQMQMTSQLGQARNVARRMGLKVDQNPGVEFSDPKFKAAYMEAIKAFKSKLDALGIAYACESVDEPRDVPNPWNRTVADTCKYGDWMGELGFKTRFVTPMGDATGSTPTLPLVDSMDIISIHAGPGSQKLQEKTLSTPGKTLWYYNTGMDRYSWGFQPFAVGVKGRWEWHWCSPEGTSTGGYIGGDWYNPFTGLVAMASNAPLTYPGGFLYFSGFLTAADGITDRHYLHTLQQAVEKNKDNAAKADTVKKAQALLAEIKSAVPPVLHAEHEKEQAAVQKLDTWRGQIGQLLKDLQ